MVNTEIRLIVFFAVKNGETLYSQQKQDWELTVAQIMNSLFQNSDSKKVGKTTKSFKYGLNKIPYNYIVEVTNRFKGLDLIEYLKDYGQRFVKLYRRQESRPSPRKRNAKWFSEEALQITVKREMESKGETERYIHLNAEFQRRNKKE